jgi:tryptophan 2,3-dioxygenase
MDKQLFLQACDEVIGQQQGMNGIGTLGEKTVHSVLKYYLFPELLNTKSRLGLCSRHLYRQRNY